MSTLQSTDIESRITGEDNIQSTENNTFKKKRRKFKKLKTIHRLLLNVRTNIRRSASNEETAFKQANNHSGRKTFLFQIIIRWTILCITGLIFAGIIFYKHHIITVEDNMENECSTYTTTNSTFAHPQNTSLLRVQMKVSTLN